MIQQLLSRFGYLHESKITENYLGKRYGELIGDVNNYGIEKEMEGELFNDLSVVNGIKEYLDATMANDMQRYFAATDEKQRDIVRGAFARTAYLKSRLNKTSQEANEEETTLQGLRYG